MGDRSTPNTAENGFYADLLNGGIAIPQSAVWLVGSNFVANTLVLESTTTGN